MRIQQLKTQQIRRKRKVVDCILLYQTYLRHHFIIVGQPEAPGNIAVVSNSHSNTRKHAVGDTLLISKKQVEILGKQQSSTLKNSTLSIPVTLVRSTDSEKCTVAVANLSKPSVRFRIKNMNGQMYKNSKFIQNLEKIQKMKPKHQEKSLIVPPIAASEASHNSDDIVINDNSLFEDIHNRTPNEIRPIIEPGGILTRTNNPQLPDSCIDLLTDSSDDEAFPSFVKPTNAVVKQYKRISDSNELRSFSKSVQMTQNIGNQTYGSNTPTTLQSTSKLEKLPSITPSYMPVTHNAPHGSEASSRTERATPPLSAISNETHLKTFEAISGRKYRNIKPKPSKPMQNQFYNSMLLNMSSSILNTNSCLPGLSEPIYYTANPANMPLQAVAPNLEFAQHHGQVLDRLQILSPQDINNRIS